jgi:hypothetical protein
LLFNFVSEYAIRKFLENEAELKLNGTHQLLAYTVDVNVLGDNINATKKSTENFIYTSKEVDLDETQRKLITNCRLLTRMQGKIIT